MGKIVPLCLGLLFCLVVRAESLDRMEQITSRAANLSAFLASREWQDEYFTALAGYMGSDRVDRAVFDRTLAQLREMKAKVPGLAERMWETGGLGKPFSVRSEVQTHGRLLDRKGWDAYVTKLRSDSAGRASFDANAKFAGDDSEEYYKALRQDPKAQGQAAALVSRFLDKEQVKDHLSSGDPDLILDFFRELRENPRKHFPDAGPLLTLVLDQLPRVDQLLENHALFPVEMRDLKGGVQVPVGGAAQIDYHFRPVPRRFHGIWKGMAIKECIAGATCADLKPERWATVAMKDTQLFYVERDGGSHLGFVQVVPINHADGRIVGSLDLGSPALRLKTITTGVDGKRRAVPLLSHWLRGYQAQMPKEWTGIASANNMLIDNAGVGWTLYHSPAYGLGTDLGPAKNWRSDMKGMIFDGGTTAYNNLKLLNLDSEAYLTDWFKLHRAIHDLPIERASRIAGFFVGRPDQYPEQSDFIKQSSKYSDLIWFHLKQSEIDDYKSRGGLFGWLRPLVNLPKLMTAKRHVHLMKNCGVGFHDLVLMPALRAWNR